MKAKSIKYKTSKKIEKTIIITFIFFTSLIIFPPHPGTNFAFFEDAPLGTDNNLDINEFIKSSEDVASGSNLDEYFAINNASQFNVSETAVFISNDDDLAIKTENLTFDIPDNWRATTINMSAYSIFENAELFSDYNMNGNFSGTIDPWVGETNYPNYENPEEEPGVGFFYDAINEYGYAEFSSGRDKPEDIYGYYANQINGFNHGTSSVELGNLYEPERSVYPIYNNFITDPGYTRLIDPYGNNKKESAVFADWISSVDALRTRIDTAVSTFGRGDPSVGFGSNFYLPFEADSVTLIMGWAVENLGYSSPDKFHVRSRVDGKYINGYTGIPLDPNITLNGNFESLEYDDNPIETLSHGVIPVFYDITNLVGPYGYRKGMHTLDFGCYMETPKSEYADVDVYWDYVLMNVTHYDWFSGATLTFQFNLTDLTADQEWTSGMSLVAYVGGDSDPKDCKRYLIGETSHLELAYYETITQTIIFPHSYMNTYKDAFEVDDLYFFVGLEKVPRFSFMPQIEEGLFHQKLIIDNFTLDVNYELGTPEGLGLQAEIVGSSQWVDISSSVEFGIDELPPKLEIEFNLSLYDSPNPHIRYLSWIKVDKFSPNAAEASVSIEDFRSEYSFWNITYNNSESITEIDYNISQYNSFYYYQYIIENLPAFDGLGGSSFDWYIESVYGPYWWDFTQQSVKTSNFPSLQNLTVQSATFGEPGGFYKGLWQIFGYQMNYMLNGSMSHDDLTSPEVYYDGEDADYDLKIRNSIGLTGNYNVSLLTSNLEFATDFPVYLSEVGNYTGDWSVYDEIPGIYLLYSTFNDTDSDNQTKRLGWWRDSFQMWRKTTGRIIDDPIGKSTLSGNTITYTVEYNYTLGGGIMGAGIQAYRFGTDNLWGQDWPPYVYLIDSVVYLGEGKYNITLKTDGIPKNDYKIYFSMHKPFYDINYSSDVWLNITGILLEMEIIYKSGAFNYSSDNAYLYGNNIPYVNDSSNFIIQFELTNKLTAERLRDAYISASFNGSSSVMTAIEEYALTHLEQDKGIYNLTLDTTNLNKTDQIVNFNYTLEIVFSTAGFQPLFHNITVEIAPIPLYVEIQEVGNIYEEETITIDTSLFLDKIQNQEGCDFGEMDWGIYNSTDQFIFGGNLPNVISNFYSTEVSFTGIYYLESGNYSIIITGSGNNLETTNSTPLLFEVFPKYVSNLTLIIPNEVRIGGFFSIAAKLTYINDSAIENQEIQFTINYSQTYSFQVLVQTETNGKAVYEMSIPPYYVGENLTVFAEFGGSGLILGSSIMQQQEILGKLPVNITILSSNEIRTGYSAQFSMNLSILGEQNYDGKIIFFFGFYENQTQPFIIRELSTNENGSTSILIDEIGEYQNITVFFEFLGSSQVSSKIENLTRSILPKWEMNFTIENIPDEIRIGQALNFNVSSFFIDPQSTETFDGLPLKVLFNYGTGTFLIRNYFGVEENVLIEYTIPDESSSNLNISIIFEETSKIKGNNVTLSYDILPKINTTVVFQSFVSGQQFTGEIFFSVNLSDANGVPLSGIEVTFYVVNSNDEIESSIIGITNEFGIAGVPIEMLNTGDFTIRIRFEGESIYSSSAYIEKSVHMVTSFSLFVEYLPYILIGIGAVVAGSFIFQRAVVIPRRKRRMEALRTIHQRLSDAENIQHIWVVSKNGLSLLSRSFTNIPIDGDLVSGFLSAISSFGAEIGGKMEKGSADGKGLEQISYKGFKIMNSDSALVRVSVLMSKDASPVLKEKIKRFNFAFQEKNLEFLQEFKGGALLPEGPILELVEQYLEVDLLYPHNINLGKIDEFLNVLDKKSIEHEVLLEAQETDFKNTFLIRDMIHHLTEKDRKEIVVFNAIDKLRLDGAVFAINPRTQFLIDQFKPMIDKLPSDSKKLLNAIYEGVTLEFNLRKTKGVTNFVESLSLLKDMQLIDQKNNLTDSGQAVVTLLRILE